MKKTSTNPATETQASKPLDKTIKFITILFRGTCPKMTARGKGDLSYELGIDEETGESYVRISGNESSGAYSNEWLDLVRIQTLLAGQQKTFSAIVMEGLFRGRSTNNHGYLAAILDLPPKNRSTNYVRFAEKNEGAFYGKTGLSTGTNHFQVT